MATMTAELIDDLRDSNQSVARFVEWTNRQPTAPTGTDDEVWQQFITDVYGVAVQ
jgi:hypothetical protein